MAITRHFKGSTDCYGYGYFGYIEEGQLVIGENWPREGGVTYRGTYRDATEVLEELKEKAPRLYNSIVKYYTDEKAKRAKEVASNPSGIMWKVKLHMNNGKTYDCQVRGLCESSVTDKLMPEKPEVVLVQTLKADVFAVRTDRIDAIEFVGEF